MVVIHRNLPDFVLLANDKSLQIFAFLQPTILSWHFIRQNIKKYNAVQFISFTTELNLHKY